MRLPAFSLVVLSLFALLAPAQYIVNLQPMAPQPLPAAAPASTQDLVFFTGDGPVRVRLTVSDSGKSAVESWRKALDKLFAFSDRDGDGKLNAGERKFLQTNSKVQAVTLSDGFAGSYGGLLPNIGFAERDGLTDRAMFGESFVNAGLGPVSLTPIATRGDSQALTDALFKHLDRDGDGKLSVAELKAARERLAHLDVNEDEAISLDELLGRIQNPYFLFLSDLAVDSTDFGGRRQTAPPLPDVFTPPVGVAITVKDLLARDKDKDGSLSLEELGCSAKVIASLDADGDGRLDSDELAAWLRSPPDLDVTFAFAKTTAGGSWLTGYTPAKTTAKIELAKKGRLADKAKVDADGTLRISSSTARLSFGIVNPAKFNALANFAVADLQAAFDLPSGGKEEFLERKEVAATRSFALAGFDFADRNGDGKLTRKELEESQRLRETLTSCRTDLEIADLGRGLFELLDTDGDGRLSPRELIAAPTIVASLDRDGDGKLARTEIPRSYTIGAKRSSINVLPSTSAIALDENIEVFISSRTTQTMPARAYPSAPEWFRQADLNGDGDVSAREFSGPTSVFKKMDANGDGLISVEEAVAYEKKMKK